MQGTRCFLCYSGRAWWFDKRNLITGRPPTSPTPHINCPRPNAHMSRKLLHSRGTTDTKICAGSSRARGDEGAALVLRGVGDVAAGGGGPSLPSTGARSSASARIVPSEATCLRRCRLLRRLHLLRGIALRGACHAAGAWSSWSSRTWPWPSALCTFQRLQGRAPSQIEKQHSGIGSGIPEPDSSAG